MERRHVTIKGRGAADNPPNRFEKIALERDPDWSDADEPAPHRTLLGVAGLGARSGCLGRHHCGRPG